MIVKGKPCIVFDVEVLKNIFTVTCKNTEDNTFVVFEVSERKNEMGSVVSYFTSTDAYFVGYNNHHYDDLIINYAIRYHKDREWNTWTNSLYNLSQLIINDDENNQNAKKYKFLKRMNFFLSIDLLTLLFSSKLRCSLKEMQVTMHYKNVLEFMTDWSKDLEVDKFDELIAYNINDVNSTSELLYRCKKDIDLRVEIEKEYGIICLSMDGVTLGTRLLAEAYMEETGISWWDLKDLRSPAEIIDLEQVILPWIKFKHPTLQRVLLDMKSQHKVSPGRKGYENTFIFGGMKVTVGVGGIHGDNGTGLIEPEEDELLLDSDVASLYPSMIIEHKFYPPHLGEAFLTIYKNIRTERLEAKANGNKVKNETLKLALNGLSGKLQEKHSWAYSPFTVMQIRINGQLLLLMLAERLLEVGCKLKQLNTDGVLYTAPKSKLKEIEKIKEEWCKETKLILEDEEFTKFFQLNINAYFAQYTNGYIKKKGLFLTNVALGKGLTPKIIPESVINYFLTGQSAEDYIKSSTDITKFLMSEKTGKQWEVEYNLTKQQRINRFFASTDGAYLYKKKVNDKKESAEDLLCLFDEKEWDSLVTDETTYIDEEIYQYNNMLASSGVTILNVFDDKHISERNINYTYYIAESIKIIEQLKTRPSLF